MSDRWRMTPTGISIDPDISFDDWANLGEQLHFTVDAAYWAIGGWVAFGEAIFGERHAAAISPDRSRRVEQALWVHKKVPIDIRHENLSHSHHRAVAGLSDTFLMARLLDMAEANGWTVATLAAAVKRAKETGGEDVMPWQPVEPETATRLFGEGGSCAGVPAQLSAQSQRGSGPVAGISHEPGLRVVAGTDVVAYEDSVEHDLNAELLAAAREAIEEECITLRLREAVAEIDRLGEISKRSAG